MVRSLRHVCPLDLSPVHLILNPLSLLCNSASAGPLNITKQLLHDAIGFDFMIHPNRFRLGVRALNRAGMRSCVDCPMPPCSCANLSFYSPWAIETGLEVAIDSAGPVCTRASAWLCDPSKPTSDPPKRCHDIALNRQVGIVGTPGGGFQARKDALRVQWEGFADDASGIDYCQLQVLRVDHPGKAQLRQRCVCSKVMPSPSCDCAVSPALSTRTAACLVVDAALQAKVRSKPAHWRTSSWLDEAEPRTEASDFSWASGLLAVTADEVGSVSMCALALT